MVVYEFFVDWFWVLGVLDERGVIGGELGLMIGV